MTTRNVALATGDLPRGGRPSYGRRGHDVHCPAAARRHAVKGDAAVDVVEGRSRG